MNKEEFAKKMEQPTIPMSDDYISKVLMKSIFPESQDKFKGYNNLIITMEEFAECSKEVSKFLRGQPDKLSLIEELADVQLCMFYIRKICDISNEDLERAIHIKIERMDRRMKDENNWK